MAIYTSEVRTAVSQFRFDRFKALVLKYAPTEHRGTTTKYVSVIPGDRDGASVAVKILIDVEVASDDWDVDELEMAAIETVAHAFHTLGGGIPDLRANSQPKN